MGDYPVLGNFPVTLTSAFTAIGMATPTELPKLDPDPHRAMHQCLFLLATAVNRLRNDAGTGHGRPGPPRKTAAGRFVTPVRHAQVEDRRFNAQLRRTGWSRS